MSFENPLFARKKTPAAVKAEAEAAAATGAVPPKIMTGTGMLGGMLKSMGVDPAGVEETFQKFIGGVEELNGRLDKMEARLDLIEKALVSNDASRDECLERIESMLKDMLAGLAQ